MNACCCVRLLRACTWFRLRLYVALTVRVAAQPNAFMVYIGCSVPLKSTAMTAWCALLLPQYILISISQHASLVSCLTLLIARSQVDRDQNTLHQANPCRRDRRGTRALGCAVRAAPCTQCHGCSLMVCSNPCLHSLPTAALNGSRTHTCLSNSGAATILFNRVFNDCDCSC